MKKYIVLILIVFLMSGCSATVNVDITPEKITENIEVYADNQSEYNKIINWNGFPLTLYYDQELSNPFSKTKEKESGVSYYSTSFYENEKKGTIKGSFSTSSHVRSSVVRNCFELYNITSDDNIYTFSTSKGLICSFYNFNVVVQTPYKIVSHNANKIDSATNTLTWNINNSNYRNASIYLEVDFSNKDISEKSNENNESSNTKDSSTVKKIILTSFILIFILIAIIVFLKLINKKNKLSDI